MEDQIKASTVLVLGAGDVGSAVAHRLHCLGAGVVVCELPKPAHARRGMAFTDALFEGSARLEGVVARHAADEQEIRNAWAAADSIPVVSLPEDHLVTLFHFDVLVDATMRKHEISKDRRRVANRVVGLGPGFVPGVNCHFAVETKWGDSLGMVLHDRAAAALSGGPNPLAGVGDGRFVTAPLTGLWHTCLAIGDTVRDGQVVGHLHELPVHAPLVGSLRGLCHDGVKVAAGQRIVEVDPRQPPHVFGLGEQPRAIARGVCRALGYGDRGGS